MSWRVGCDLGTAREHVRVARALAKLPLIDAALGRAELSYAKVRALTRVATPENEAKLLELARYSTAPQIEVLCRKYRSVVDPHSPSAERFLTRRECESGMVRLSVQLLPEEAAVVEKALQAAIKLAHETKEGGGVSVETPSRVDALVSVCESFLAEAAREKSVKAPFEVAVHVSVETLSGKEDGLAELEDGSRISAEAARRLTCDAPIVEVAESGDGKALDLGRRTRRISAALAKALEKRDRGCRFPGCTNRIWVDAHHIEHWSRGGATDLANLLLLCRRHHRLVHEGGFGVQAVDGGFSFFNRFGDEVRLVPPIPLVEEAEFFERFKEDLDGIDAETNVPRWDGSRFDYGLAIENLVDARAPRGVDGDALADTALAGEINLG